MAGVRMLGEGAVQAGDEIAQVAAGPEAMIVAEVDALLYLPGHPRPQVLRALRIPALPEGWKASFRAVLEQAGTAGNAGLGRRQPESESVVSVHLSDPGGAASRQNCRRRWM